MTSKWALAALLLVPSLIFWEAQNANAQYRYPGGAAPYPGAISQAMYNMDYGQGRYDAVAQAQYGAPGDCDTSGYANSPMLYGGGCPGGACGGYPGEGCGGGYGGECGGGCEGPCNTIRVTADALFLKLGPPAKQGLVIDQNSGDPVLTTRDLAFGTKVGTRFTVDYNYCDDKGVQLLYFGLHNYNSSASTRGGDNNLALPGDIGLATDDFFGADLMSVTYDAELNNAEFNFTQQTCCKGISLLAGFRYVSLTERFNIHSIDSDAEQSDYFVGTRNELYGSQIGCQLCHKYGNLDLQIFGKAGAFANTARQTTSLLDNGNQFGLRDFSTKETELSLVADVGLNCRVELCSWLALRGGYNVIWLSNIARGPDQLDFTDTFSSGSVLHSDGDVVLHGLHVGVEGAW